MFDNNPRARVRRVQGDSLFRLVLIVGLALVLPVAVIHRLKARAADDRLDRREEGVFILLTLRPLGMAGMLSLLLFFANPGWMAWSAIPLPDAVRWVGVGIGVIGGVLFIATLRALGPNLTDTVVTRARHTLVTTGPYRWVRHPFYLASALAVLANTLAAANWFIGLTGGAAVVLLVVRSNREEQNLEKRFGAEYAEYVHRTGRFLPRFSERLCGDARD